MKRILSLVLAVFVGLGSLYACAKKKTISSNDLKGEVTVIVMDTSQALLPHADVTAGKNVLRTSWDGRVVLKPEVLAGVKKLTIACDGYKSQSVTLDDPSTPVLVRLVPSLKRVKEDVYATDGRFAAGRKYDSFGAARDARVLYKTASVDGAEAVAEMAMVDAERPDVKPEAHPMVVGAANNAISAGKLTAGEVNDFTKWNLWHHIIDSTHKKFLPDWRLELRQRYTVQVVNKENYPVANYPVSLLDIKGNTVFQAVTDNTGKAELWANIAVGTEQVAIREPEKLIVVDEPCQPSLTQNSSQSDGTSDVDVVFVFDATGSMGDELRYLRAEMQDVIARAAKATGGLAIRTGAVVYRDHGDEYLTRISRLTSDISTTQAFISDQHASGGGDFPEAVPEALMAALNSSGWNTEARARIAFLVLDAPCHKDSATIALLHEQVLNAAALGVRIVPVVCSGLDTSGELLMRSIALATNGTSFFLTDDSGIGNKHLKPTTDSLKVEHLNDMLVRTIVEFSTMPNCETAQLNLQEIEVEEQFIPNPFDVKQIEIDPSIPHGPTVLYLLDISGKLITIMEGNFDEITLNYSFSPFVSRLPIGVYFVKAFYDGEWHTKKVLVR